MRRVAAIAVLSLAACVHAPPAHHAAAWPEARAAIAHDGLSVAKPVFAADLDAPALPANAEPDAVQKLQADDGPPPTVLDPTNPRDAAFLRNDWVGNVRFGGGFVHVGDVGLDVRARIVELGQDDVYRPQASAWVEQMLADDLAERGVDARPLTWADVPGPKRTRVRERQSLDGRDDVNLPRTAIAPAPLEDARRESAKAAGAGDYVLVPIVRSYLSHNGGWFVGETWGCLSGARTELLLVVYDVRDGAPVWWLATEASVLDRPPTPSTADVDGALLDVERQTEKVVRKRLLR